MSLEIIILYLNDAWIEDLMVSLDVMIKLLHYNMEAICSRHRNTFDSSQTLKWQEPHALCNEE